MFRSGSLSKKERRVRGFANRMSLDPEQESCNRMAGTPRAHVRADFKARACDAAICEKGLERPPGRGGATRIGVLRNEINPDSPEGPAILTSSGGQLALPIGRRTIRFPDYLIWVVA